MKRKKGISLIVLIITIIVVIILAAAVILTMSNNNPISSAKEATFKSDVRSFQDELAMYISNDYVSKQGQRDSKITTSDFAEMQGYIPSLTNKYKGVFKIVDDELFFIWNDVTKKVYPQGNEWAQNVSIKVDNMIDDTSNEEFDAQEWDKSATSEECFQWDNNTIVGYNIDELKECTSIKIPSRCEKINIKTFYTKEQLQNIQNVELPNTINQIGTGAFLNFNGLQEIDIPSSVTNIGNYAFQECSSLSKVNIVNSKTNISIDAYAFYSCISLTNITIPSNVIYIEDKAFADCSALMNIEISNNLSTVIVSTAFNNTLWYNTQPDGLIYLGNILLGYKGVIHTYTSIDIKEGTTCIANHCFSSSPYENLIVGNLVIPNSVKYIGEGAFSQCSISSVEIPNSVTYIGNGAFLSCDNLLEVTIPSSITSIERSTFSNCDNLKSVIIPDSVTNIGETAFEKCPNLTNFSMSKNVKYIGEGAFSKDTNLKEIIIMSNVDNVERRAFEDWTITQQIKFKDNQDVTSKWHQEWNKNCNANIEWAYVGE